MSSARSVSLFGAFLLVSVAGCGGESHDVVLKDTLSKLKELSATLKEVKDVSTAKTAAPKLKSLTAELTALTGKIEKLPKRTAAEEKAMNEKYDAERQKLSRELEGELIRIATLSDDVSQEIEAAMKTP